MIVMTLYGKGVIPAMRTAQNPTSLKRLLKASMLSALPKACKIGCPMVSKASAPIAYPNRPPKTDETSATLAIKNALDGAARIIGIIKISGGMGKTELSTKDTSASTQSALGCSAMDKVQLYNRWIIWLASPHYEELLLTVIARLGGGSTSGTGCLFGYL